MAYKRHGRGPAIPPGDPPNPGISLNPANNDGGVIVKVLEEPWSLPELRKTHQKLAAKVDSLAEMVTNLSSQLQGFLSQLETAPASRSSPPLGAQVSSSTFPNVAPQPNTATQLQLQAMAERQSTMWAQISQIQEGKGNAAFSAGDYESPIRHFTEAIKLAPTNHVLYSNRSASYASLQRYSDATSDAIQTVELKPDWAKGYSRLGAVHNGLDHYQHAISAYSKGLEIDPFNAPARLVDKGKSMAYVEGPPPPLGSLSSGGRETKSEEMDLSVLEGGEGGDCVKEESFVNGSLGNSEELDVEGNEDQSYVTAESSDTSSVELSVDVVEGGGKNKYVEDEYSMGKIYEKLEKLDIVESGENQSTGDCHVSEAVFNSITPRSVLGENVATGFKIENPVDDGKGLVSFGDAALQSQDSEAEVKMSFKEKGSTDEQDLTRFPLYAESVPHGIKICEIEEEEAVTGKDSNSCVKLFKTAAELKGVDNSDLVSIAEESIMQCSNIKRSDVDICQNYGASSSEVYSVCDSDFEGSKDQITNSETYAEPNPFLNILYLGKRNLAEAAEDNEYILCSDFLDLITPSSTATVDHIFGDKTRVQSCKIGRRISGVSISHLGDDATTGLKIDDQIAVGKHMLLIGSAGDVERQYDTACRAKLELRPKEKHFPLMQDKTSFDMSLMKWGGLVVKMIHKTNMQNKDTDQGKTLLVIVSDLGMTESGNHGGSSYEETHSLAVFIGLKNDVSDYLSSAHNSVYQVDIAPTLSLLLGVPIPKNNVGVLIPEIFRSLSEDPLLKALELNSSQLLRLLQAQIPGLSCRNHPCDDLELAESFYRISVGDELLGGIVPAIGAAGFAAAATATRSVTGSIAVAASFGAGLTGVKMARRTGNIKEFEFKAVEGTYNQGRLGVGIVVSGMVFEDEDYVMTWDGYNDHLERYALFWESKNLVAFSTAIQDWLNSKIAVELMKEGAMLTVLNSLVAALAMPATLVTASDLIDSKWAIAVDR